MKTFYQVRIDEELRNNFIAAIPWGYQGQVLEAFIVALLEKTAEDGQSLSVAKLIDGRYKLTEKET